MTERIVELAEGPVRLHVRNGQLIVSREGQPEVSTPLAEIAVLLLSQPHAQITQAVLSGIALAGGTVVICDSHFLPAGMLLPLQSHFVQTERFAQQAELGQPLRKRLWQEIVRAKIRAQGRLLQELRGDNAGLPALVARVGSGDPENVEAQAARRYWPVVFANPAFHRARDGPPPNNLLNYGYTVLRAAVSRALCGAGLHPSFGLKHSNRYDTFSLASDLMEPFRPLVDRAVALWVRDHDPTLPVGREAKSFLIGAIQSRYQIEGEARTLPDTLGGTSAALARAIGGEQERFAVPEVGPPCPGD